VKIQNNIILSFKPPAIELEETDKCCIRNNVFLSPYTKGLRFWLIRFLLRKEMGLLVKGGIKQAGDSAMIVQFVKNPFTGDIV